MVLNLERIEEVQLCKALSTNQKREHLSFWIGQKIHFRNMREKKSYLGIMWGAEVHVLSFPSNGVGLGFWPSWSDKMQDNCSDNSDEEELDFEETWDLQQSKVRGRLKSEVLSLLHSSASICALARVVRVLHCIDVLANPYHGYSSVGRGRLSLLWRGGKPGTEKLLMPIAEGATAL